MRRSLSLLPLLFCTALAAPAWAQDDDDERSETIDEELDRLLEEDAEDDEGDEDFTFDGDEDEPFEFEDDPMAAEGEDLLGEEPEDETPGEGEDNAAIYRDYQAEVRGLEPDEEVAAWERYLAAYPDTAFRSRIEDRIDVLMDELYSERIIDDPGEPVDALQQEIPFAQALLLENINPRTRLQVGFEWGLPDWLNLYGNYEYQIARDFSVHGGIRHRYTGWSLEAGVKWSPVKSLRTDTLVTLLGDLRFNADPAFLGIRPQVAAGKIFGDVVHVQVQAGVDVEARRFAGVHLIGGANVTWMASEQVALFAETAFDMKNLTWEEGGVFRYNTVSFGLKFFPTPGGLEPGQLESNVGASAPYSSNYWMFHFGSIMGQVNYYPEAP